MFDAQRLHRNLLGVRRLVGALAQPMLTVVIGINTFFASACRSAG